MTQVDELRELIYCADVPATVGTRARNVLWYAENRLKRRSLSSPACRARR